MLGHILKFGQVTVFLLSQSEAVSFQFSDPYCHKREVSDGETTT